MQFIVLSQQVHRPTRKSNIVDLIFCPSKFINTISVYDTFIIDHQMFAVETYIPDQCLAPKQLLNSPSNKCYNLYFHKADWPNILLALQSIDWAITLEPTPPPSSFYFFIDIIYHKCVHHVPLKIPVKQKSLNFIERERS